MIRYIYARLRSFFISPFFSLLIMAVLIIVAYYLCFEPTVYLCDGGDFSLYNLKVNLTNEMARYRIAQVNYQYTVDLQEQYTSWRPHNYRNVSLEQEYATKLELSILEMNSSTAKIIQLENAIKIKDPNFSISSLRLKNW